MKSTSKDVDKIERVWSSDVYEGRTLGSIVEESKSENLRV